MAATFTVDYCCRNMLLAVKPVVVDEKEELFEVLHATVDGEKISEIRLNSLISDTKSLLDKTDVDSQNVESVSQTFVTPTKKRHQKQHQPSPTSICGLTEETIEYYNTNFIQNLATTFFESTTATVLPTPVEPHQPILLSIEGNIGAGKSTLLRALRLAHPDWTFIDEPIDTWTALRNDTGNLLECFYGDQDRWAYTFQNCSILSRFQLIENAIKDNKDKYPGKHVYITERSLGTDYHVFAKMLKDDGKLDEMEFELYERWLAELEKTCTPLSGIVLVDTSPQTCVDRIKVRNREGEDGIPLSYLELLHTFQNRWLDAIEIPCKKTCTQEGIEEFVDYMLSR